ncbi:hypothetical protein T4D_8080 [Trichinella pseudospiralis]|uniref:Uncharacterized protein n=1 Tax=Trichinella pseudospiralis TaxID=6337 RepID=A0A0V1FMS0_TRIPS|nr:hypothetical protein T4D_8080 [Trichinella pseudospiralis]
MTESGQYLLGRLASSSLTRPNFTQQPVIIRNQFPNVSVLSQNNARFAVVSKPILFHVATTNNNNRRNTGNYSQFQKENLHRPNAAGNVLVKNKVPLGTKSKTNKLIRIAPNNRQAGISPRVLFGISENFRTTRCNNVQNSAPSPSSIRKADQPFKKLTAFTIKNHPVKQSPQLLDAGPQEAAPPPKLNENQLSPTTNAVSTPSCNDVENETNNSNKEIKQYKNINGCNVLSELIYFHFEKNNLPKLLRSVLPKIFDYHVVKYRIRDKHSFDAKIRLKANTKFSLMEWLREFELLSNTIYHSQQVYKNIERYAYHERFRCEMSRIHRAKRADKGKRLLRTNCKAAIDVKLLSDYNHDVHKKIGMVGEVNIHFLHDHSELPAIAPIQLIKNEFFNYYQKMISPTTAKRNFCQYHQKEIKEYMLAAPRLQTIRCWYRNWNQQSNTTTAIIQKHTNKYSN